MRKLAAVLTAVALVFTVLALWTLAPGLRGYDGRPGDQGGPNHTPSASHHSPACEPGHQGNKQPGFKPGVCQLAVPAFGPGAAEGQGNNAPHETPNQCHPPGKTDDLPQCQTADINVQPGNGNPDLNPTGKCPAGQNKDTSTGGLKKCPEVV